MEDQDIRQAGWRDSGLAELVSRTVYASQANIIGSVYSQMEQIRASAVRHNEPAGVCTALLHQSGWFVQWKEGPAGAVERIMERVATDWRHHSMRVVHASIGPRLLSGPWSMAIVQCGEDPEDMTRRVTRLRNACEAGVQFAPPAVWRQLSTPMRHPGAAHQADPEAFQRVLACASAGWGSYELVDWLARTRGEHVVHRRFAGAQDLDVGTDLVDFAEEERTVRVIAMARKGLLLPLTRAFLPDYSHVVLLLCGDGERDAALVQKVALACAALVAPPVVLAVAVDPASHAVPWRAARMRGLPYLPLQADGEAPDATWAAVQPVLAEWRIAANSGGLPLAAGDGGGRA